MNSQRLLTAGYVVLAVVMVLWDILLAGRIAQLRRTPRGFQAVTAFAGLLLVPAILVAISAASILLGRAIQPVSWLWAVTTSLFAIQALYAVSRRLVSPMFGFPLLFYNLIIAIAAISRYIVSHGAEPPEWALALNAAQARMLATFFGAAALWKASYLQIPLFSPSLPARWRITGLIRVVIAVIATAMTALVLVELPGALAGVRSFAGHTRDQLQEHPEGDFELGLKIFPDLRNTPPPLAVEGDLALADSLDIDAISVVINPEAARGVPLDSIARSVEHSRTDSTRLIVTLGYPKKAEAEFRSDRAGYAAARLKDVDRIARRLRPDILIPAKDPYDTGTQAIGLQPVEYWIDFFTRAARIAHYVNPRIKVGMAMSSYGVRDSVLYAWAASPLSPIDVPGFSLLPGFDGAISLDTHLRIAQRWMKQYPARPKPHWVFAAGGYPLVHGERNQQLAILDVLAWATAQAAIKGVVIDGAGDYDALRGLRAPGGRLRSSVGAILRAHRGLRESGAR